MKHFAKALITGASSGIGEALAHLLAKEKIPLILCGRNKQALDRLAKTLPQVKVHLADLSIKEERDKLCSLIEEEVPDLVINNAGFTVYGDTVSTQLKESQAIFDVNATAVLDRTLLASASATTLNNNNALAALITDLQNIGILG